MKRFFLYVFSVLLPVGLVLALTSFGGDDLTDYPGGSPAGYTGSPGDGKDCMDCHGGSTSFVEGWITSDIPVEGYTPGVTYNLTVTVSGSGDKGFQVSPQDLTGMEMGTLIAGPNTHLNGGTKYVNQNSKSTANPATWNFQWTAPPAGSGEVTFYGAFTVNKPVTRTSTLTVQESMALPLVIEAVANPVSVCTGDSSHLDVLVTGGSGTYTYLWTSKPAGFSSTLKDPWVSPTEVTRYLVEVSDGIQTISDSVDVFVYCLGVEPGERGSSITLYPIPFREYLNLRFDQSPATDMEILLYTVSGQLVLQNRADCSAGSHILLETGLLAPGSYLLQVRSCGKDILRKIVLHD